MNNNRFTHPVVIKDNSTRAQKSAQVLIGPDHFVSVLYTEGASRTYVSGVVLLEKGAPTKRLARVEDPKLWRAIRDALVEA